MTVLPGAQINFMVAVMDDLLKNPGKKVADFKTKYNLTSEEFNMIYDLTMPLIRAKNGRQYWASKYYELLEMMRRAVYNDQSKSAERIRAVLEASAPSAERKTLKEMEEDLEDENEEDAYTDVAV